MALLLRKQKRDEMMLEIRQTRKMKIEATKKTLKIIRMKAKQRAAQGVTSLCEMSFICLET